jgi:F0F1-type ATP synthase assembly protein I
MRKMMINIMASTGITLVILAVIGTLFNAKFLFISSVFQSLLANIVINAGFCLTSKFESKYVALEIALDISYTMIVLIIFGAIFDWFTNGTPIWILIIMAVLIYLFGILISLFRIREDIETINQLLQNRNNKTNSKGKEH